MTERETDGVAAGVKRCERSDRKANKQGGGGVIKGAQRTRRCDMMGEGGGEKVLQQCVHWCVKPA